MKLDKKVKLLNIIILIISIFIVYLLSAILISTRKINIEDKFYTYQEYYEAYLKLSSESDYNKVLTKKEYRQLISEELNDLNQLYIYIEKDNLSSAGLSVLAFRTIIINSNIPEYEYCITLVHELLHLKKYSLNEQYITFETFKVLYTSDNQHLKNIGAMLGTGVLVGSYGAEYNCTPQIIDFLRGN